MSIWIKESPIEMIEGETITYAVTFLGIASDISSPDATVYKNGEDVTSTVMPSGSHSVVVNTITMKPVVAGDNDGGESYIVVVEGVMSGNTEKRKLQIDVLSKTDEM